MSKTYELSLTKDYVANWGFVQAVRELLQNAIDNPNPMCFDYVDGTLMITSVGSSLSTESLLLGATTKSDSPSTIGSFGEGYKIAVLVLTRLGKAVKIYNSKVIWTPEIKRSKVFGNIETLHVHEQTHFGSSKDLVFEIKNVSESERDDVVKSCLQLQDEESIGTVRHTSFGKILMDQPSKLYVNGLYVCDTELKFGYDMKPEHLKLERDRQTVSSFDLQYKTTQMWLETGDWPFVANLLMENTKDVAYAQYFSNKDLTDKLVEVFDTTKSVVAVCDDMSMQEAKKAGNIDVKIVPSAVFAILNNDDDYKSRVKTVPEITPYARLKEFLDVNEHGMDPHVCQNFEALMEESNGWRIDR